MPGDCGHVVSAPHVHVAFSCGRQCSVCSSQNLSAPPNVSSHGSFDATNLKKYQMAQQTTKL